LRPGDGAEHENGDGDGTNAAGGNRHTGGV
jgi:hypothetical protein